MTPVGIEFRTSRFGVRRSTTTPPRSLINILSKIIKHIKISEVFACNSGKSLYCMGNIVEMVLCRCHQTLRVCFNKSPQIPVESQ